MQVGTWPERRAALEKFQGALQEKFPEMDYNVFVFGSFVRDDFQDGKSDIDMIVYCEDMLKRMEIAEFCSEYFKRRQLEADVLEYYYMEDAYTYAVGILNSIQMTEYYPKKLRNELYVITRRYARYLEGQRRKLKYMRWDYTMWKRRKEENNHGGDAGRTMKNQALKLLESYDRYIKCDDERMKDDLLEAMSSRINHIAQAFCDIMAFIEISERNSAYEESWGYYARQYLKREIPKPEESKQAADFLRRRNDIVHDYFNIDRLNRDVLKAVANFGQGFLEMTEDLKEYCYEKFPEFQMEQNISKMKKTARR